MTVKLHISADRFDWDSHLIFETVITYVSLHREKITISIIFFFLVKKIDFNTSGPAEF